MKAGNSSLSPLIFTWLFFTYFLGHGNGTINGIPLRVAQQLGVHVESTAWIQSHSTKTKRLNENKISILFILHRTQTPTATGTFSCKNHQPPPVLLLVAACEECRDARAIEGLLLFNRPTCSDSSLVL